MSDLPTGGGVSEKLADLQSVGSPQGRRKTIQVNHLRRLFGQRQAGMGDVFSEYISAN